ncbi:MAG: fumarylacetoacetate hydrolase family protein [Ignavibacteriaceae bacterium]|nr:fumarylacetoacetate hydrolase family protein [Ignavibacteriaceae bacterium]
MRFGIIKNVGAALITEYGYLPFKTLGFDISIEELISNEQTLLNKIEAASLQSDQFINYEKEQLCAPLQKPGKIVAIGLNYIDHASESKMELPKHPLVFTKFNSSITGPFDPINIPSQITSKVDYEVELAVVIGRKAKNVSKENALDYVFGYTIINDLSARDIQFDDGQWVRGKSLDTFCPMGPFIVTKDEINDPQNLQLSCSINNNLLQNASTKDMIFGVADLISILSHSFTFEPGDIISTGTPSGVGFIRKPPVFLKDNDTLTTEISHIGKLINKVKVL